ncbi:MAG: hypothetical protein KY445_02425 [Armatimonadetes bacterium]|nr:hypothetical protein [Armatimonadota bacterium]
MAKKVSDATHPTKTGKDVISNGKTNGKAKSAATSALSQKDAKTSNGKGQSMTAEEHLAKANKHMLRAWKAISQYKDTAG